MPVLTSPARALRWSHDERHYLFQLAGQAEPTSGRILSRLTPGVLRLLERLDDTPVSVYDAAWTLLAWNPLWAALMGEASTQRGRQRNVAWR